MHNKEVIVEVDVEKKVEEAARKEALKMGDSLRHEEEDWSWDECDPEWERKNAEIKKKIDRYRKCLKWPPKQDIFLDLDTSGRS